MAVRSRTRCTATRPRLDLPARRAACRSLAPGVAEALLGEPGRLYLVVGRTVDVLDRDGLFLARMIVGDGLALAEALLRDATGNAPRPATIEAFQREVIDHVPQDGFAVASSEVCGWLLLRAIERTDS